MFPSATTRRILLGYLLALTLCGAGTGLQWVLPSALQARFPFLAFYPAVAATAWYGGFAPGMLATLASGVAADYFLAGLAGQPGADQASDAVGLSAFVLTGLMLSILAEAGHQRERREREGRLVAEHVSLQTDRLQELTTALSRAKTSAEVIEICVLEAVYNLSAAAGALVLVERNVPPAEPARAVGFSSQLLARWRAIPADLKTPLTEAVRTRELVVYRSRSARLAAHPELGANDPFGAYEAAIIAPVTARGPVVAVLVLACDIVRTWTADEEDFLRKLSQRTAQALDRARLYEFAERARAEAEALRARADQELAERQKAEEALRESEARYRALATRTSRLHALSAALSEAVTLDAVGRAVVRQGKVVVGAQGGSVTLLADNGTQFTRLHAEDDERLAPEGWERFRVEPGLCSTKAVQTRQPVFVGSFAEWQKYFWRSAPIAADGGYASTAVLPLLAEGAVIGVLAFRFTAPLNFDEDYKALLTSVAQHCAQALDRARLYEAEQRARADAEAANRSKDDFLSTVSHELRTPLNAVLGWASMLRLGTLDPDRIARATQSIYDNATRQAHLIDDLLDVSRIVAGRVTLDLQDIDVFAAVRGAVESMMPLAETKGIDIQLGPPCRALVSADPRRLEQIFLNLLSNAIKFTPSGGRVDVQMTARADDVDIRVSDTGIGIDAAFLPHVFDRFRQADGDTTRTHGGLGLGLSIAKYLVDAHHGAVRVQSAGRGRGTSFVVSFPRAAGRTLSAAELPAGGDSFGRLPDLSGVRVLVVDDEPDACEMMTSVLNSCRATVLTAFSVQQAMDTISRAQLDVLLADIGMPVEDGYSLIRRVRHLPSPNAAIPAAAVTAYAKEDERNRILAAGFQLHLAKPLDASRLLDAVTALLQTRTTETAEGG